MEYSEYRSKCLKKLWPKFYRQFNIKRRNLIRQPRFSTHTIDNLCAINWKNENPIDMCVSVLIEYLNDISEDIK